MKLKKYFMPTLYLIIFVLAITCIFANFLKTDQSVSVRNINVNEIGTLSYEEKVEKLKEQFTNVTTSETNYSYCFSGEICFDSYDLVSTNYEGEDVKEKYSSEIDKVTESITIEKDVVVNNEIVDSLSETFATQYDEETGKHYLIDSKGNKIDILSELEDENVNECFVLALLFTTLTAKIVASICVVTAAVIIIENADTIANGIDDLLNGVKDGAISFWESIKLAFGAITAVALSTPIAILTVAQAEKIYEVAKNRKDCYLLLAPISSTEPISILYKFTNLANARNWINKGGSIWSPFSSTTKTAIKSAGYLAGGLKNGVYTVNAYEHHSSKVGLPTFNHYHTLKGSTRVNYTCHGFFGLPYINA